MDLARDVLVLKRECRHTLEDLARLARAPLKAVGADKAVAFGAYARGTADGYSDLDLAVVLATDKPFAGGLEPKFLASILKRICREIRALKPTPKFYFDG